MISIIVPVYNVEKYIKTCIESIINQTYKDLEIILVDDGSTDSSGEICDQYAKRDTRIDVIHKENEGLVNARKTGLAAASGEYIGFVDSDDWVEPDMYETLLEDCMENDADVAVGLMIFEHTNNSFLDTLNIRKGLYDNSKELCENLYYTKDRKNRGITPSVADKLFKRDLLIKYLNQVDERITNGEDACCTYPYLINANRVYIDDKNFYHCRVRDDSMQHSVDEVYFGRINLCYLQLKKHFEAHKESEILLKQLHYYMLEHIMKGVNYTFGFANHVLVPYFIPPFDQLKKRNAREIVLYGAGVVGQDYRAYLKNQIGVEIVCWCDKQYEKYQKQGMKVSSVEEIKNVQFDAILIAAEKKSLGEQITENLIQMGIEKSKIIYFQPRRLADSLEDK